MQVLSGDTEFCEADRSKQQWHLCSYLHTDCWGGGCFQEWTVPHLQLSRKALTRCLNTSRNAPACFSAAASLRVSSRTSAVATAAATPASPPAAAAASVAAALGSLLPVAAAASATRSCLFSSSRRSKAALSCKRASSLAGLAATCSTRVRVGSYSPPASRACRGGGGKEQRSSQMSQSAAGVSCCSCVCCPGGAHSMAYSNSSGG